MLPFYVYIVLQWRITQSGESQQIRSLLFLKTNHIFWYCSLLGKNNKEVQD